METTSSRNQRLFDTERPVAVVTGSGAPRVGRSIAERLLEEQFRVVFHAHHSLPAARGAVLAAQQRGQNASLVTGAVEDQATVERWVKQVYAEYGRCDLLVNSAAIWDPQPLETTTSQDFERYFRVNALGTALTCQHFGLAMCAQPSGGSIINIGDWAVSRPYRDFAAYFPSKAAVTSITDSMAIELATRNPRVRVNAVLPGPVQLAEDIAPEHRELVRRECLLQREGTAADVAHAVLFLATSPFVTGVKLPVDGGRSIYAGPSADPHAHPSASLGNYRTEGLETSS